MYMTKKECLNVGTFEDVIYEHDDFNVYIVVNKNV